MNEQTSKRARLGAFVLIATTCLILGLYYIGSKKNIFNSTILVSTSFNNVGGLMPGNNIRFNGINVGTVSKVYAISDTAIKVEFTIEENETKFISKNAIASIGTDGLLGNKLIEISPSGGVLEPVEEGSFLRSINPVQMDMAIRTLLKTNDNIKVITDNLKEVSQKFNSNNTLWRLLTDTSIAENVKNAIVNFKVTGENTAILTGDLRTIVQHIQSGKGTIGALLTDTALTKNLRQTVVNIKSITDSVAIISGNFKSISSNIVNGKGAVGTLVTDTTFVHNLNESMKNIKDGSAGFNDNMEALKHTWPFKKYFKKKTK